ncbi:hypothetical protein LDENG_00138670 [Lucifuga dentata]|nr:hypothetical protein LDENG_00138670 [Lucifuga dentata]
MLSVAARVVGGSDQAFKTSGSTDRERETRYQDSRTVAQQNVQREQHHDGLVRKILHPSSSEVMAAALSFLLLLLCSLAPAEAQLKLFNLRASDLPAGLLGTTDGYVKVFCGSAFVGETSVCSNNAYPWWEEEFTYFSAQQNDVLRLEVFDSDFFFDDLLGICQRQLKVGTHQHDCFLKKGGTLHYSYTLGGGNQ